MISNSARIFRARREIAPGQDESAQRRGETARFLATISLTQTHGFNCGGVLQVDWLA
jgi:hypothetical protein